MILLVAFPAISKASINFASLIKKPDPETKMKCDQLTELRKIVVEYAKKTVDQADDLLVSLDNYINMLIESVISFKTCLDSFTHSEIRKESKVLLANQHVEIREDNKQLRE
jgi:hypothetical protein